MNGFSFDEVNAVKGKPFLVRQEWKQMIFDFDKKTKAELDL